MQLSNRKENADTYALSSKHRRTIISNGLNSPDTATGLLLPTDRAVKEEINGTSTHAATRCRGRFYLGDKVGSVTKHLSEVRYPSGDGVGVMVQGDNSLESVNGNKAVFAADAGTYEINSEILHHGVRNTILITDPTNAPNEYVLTLKDKGNACYTYEIVRGGIIGRDLNGGGNIYIDAPWAADAAGNPGAVTYILGVKVGKIQTVYKIIDLLWLRSRTGWVESDPLVTIEDGVDGGVIEDAMLYGGGSANNNFGAWIYTGTSNGTADVHESGATKVDLSAYVGVTVTSAKFRWYCKIKQANVNYIVDIHPILRAWDEGNKNNAAASSGEITFNSSQHSIQSWTTAGCRDAGTDRGPDLLGSYNPSTDITLNQYNDVILDPALVQSNLIEGVNNGVIAQPRTFVGTTEDGCYFGSAEDTNPVQFVLDFIAAGGGVGVINGGVINV